MFAEKEFFFSVTTITVRNIEFRQGPIYVVNSHFLRPPNRHKSSNSTKSSWPIFTISESFPMRYCMTLYLKWYQKYHRSNLKSLNLLNKSWTFNFDLSYFWYSLRYRIIQYLIGKLSDMVKIDEDSSFMAALLASVRVSWKVTICYINGALLILNWYPL